uniref:Uncharacterized protein n=1 Tax=Rhizophora mucronata TaxID=61149 RepID=A0A2P2J722_RHIMU
MQLWFILSCYWCPGCVIMLNQAKKTPISTEWLPGYVEMKRALELYGYLFSISSRPQFVNSESGGRGPPKNIRSWIKFIDACVCMRSGQHIFSLSDAEELVEIIICLCLDCQLQGLLMLLYQCMQSVISYFTDEEWGNSCENIAKSLASRVPADYNCLQTVECISVSGARFNHLRSTLSYNILLICFDNKVTNEEGILSTLIAINLKDKKWDLLKMYIYLVLTQNWLLHNPILEERPMIYEMWGVYLQNCSCHITSTDLRPYASKVCS